MGMTFLTKNEFAYKQLKLSIITGEFKPGERLIINELAKKWGISSIPVREAITKMSAEGLVNMVPHVGATVSPINYAELKENYLIRTELEGLATFYAVRHLTEEDLEMLQKNIETMRKLIIKKEYNKVGPINKEFHQIIYRACPYKKISRMIFELWDSINRLQSIFALIPQRAESSLQEHIRILQALKQRNSHRAQSLMRKQTRFALKALECYFEANKGRVNPYLTSELVK